MTLNPESCTTLTTSVDWPKYCYVLPLSYQNPPQFKPMLTLHMLSAFALTVILWAALVMIRIFEISFLLQQGNPRHALNYAWRLLSLDPPNPKTKQRMSDVIAWLKTEIAQENVGYKSEGRRIPSQVHPSCSTLDWIMNSQSEFTE